MGNRTNVIAEMVPEIPAKIGFFLALYFFSIQCARFPKPTNGWNDFGSPKSRSKSSAMMIVRNNKFEILYLQFNLMKFYVHVLNVYSSFGFSKF